MGLEILFPLRGEQLGMSYSKIGLIFTSYMIVFSLTQTPIGLISSKIGNYRLILCVLTVGSAIALFLFITVDTFYGMLFISGVLGIFLGGVFTQSTAFASDLVPSDRKGVTLAIFDAFIDSTFMLAPILTGVLTLDMSNLYIPLTRSET